MSVRAHRGIVVAEGGVAAASQPLAVATALHFLGRGAGFADAAIAASAVLCVVEPWNSHLGGDAFLIVHDAAMRTNTAFNGSGEAPAAVASLRPGGIPLRGPRAATVPGLVSTWFALHERHGVLPMAELLQPAIGYAADGFPAGPRMCLKFAGAADLLRDHGTLAALGAGPDVRLGQRVRQPELAATLERVAAGGRDGFYRGETARRIAAASEGWFTEDDLALHRTRILEPLRGAYRDLVVHGQPPPSQGMILIEELLLADGWNLADMDETERIHRLVEAKRRAFTDRNAWLADPEFTNIPLERLFSREAIESRRASIHPGRVAADPALAPESEGNDTTYFLVADGDGNAVSFIQSIFHNFGAAWIPEGTGILFNNRATGFSPDPASPNAPAPGKRPAHTLNAWLATRADGTLAYVGGTPGGHIQVQTNLQLLVNAVDLGMNVQEAVEAPRWQDLAGAGAVSAEESGPGILEVEDRVDESVLQGLRDRGHVVKAIGPWEHGSAAQLMEVLPGGAFAVGSDPRCDGHAGGI